MVDAPPDCGSIGGPLILGDSHGLRYPIYRETLNLAAHAPRRGIHWGLFFSGEAERIV
ncbi:MAG: hypothetical protein AAF961_18150 [Planctomycetota bacterium]